ncbi:substrate-binding domain-containing protein [Demequina lignilytica]|uniref:Substrate-binding domain-containing protein n=1 Tax=Demequina lignilytica TaxID=3051663 RepID=A0AB35MET3_9MICO|nr:substrate-binding domain-containing protein [Demequina sp. SYSU T0a273]MDN4482260.1 substrate-binding domain-containing protein [Demequina sp. SYSU T0a273]
MHITFRHPRRRGVAVAALATSAALALAACTSGQATPASSNDGTAAAGGDGALTIAFLQKQGDQQYFVDEADGAKDAAASAGDVDVKVVDLGTDSNKAISEVEAAIAQGVDGIIIVVPDQQIGPAVIQMATDAGIPIMAADDPIADSSGAEAPFAGFDGTSMGNQVGAKAAELYLEYGWSADDTVILSATQEDLSVCQQRVEGAADSFAEAVGDDVPEIITIGTDNSSTDAQNKAGAVITANSGVTNWVVWGCNDETETGVVTALQNAGVAADSIAGVGLGAYLTCKDWAADLDTGNKAALFISGFEVGKAAANSMIAYLRDGTELPPKSIADTHIVDAETWEEAGVVCT